MFDKKFDSGSFMRVKKCSYPRCDEDIYGGFDSCILHLKVPDESDPQFIDINDQKTKKIQDKIRKSDYDFNGAQFYSVNISGIKINDNLFFNDVFIKKDATFRALEINGHANFNRLIIEKGKLDLSYSKIMKGLNMFDANITGTLSLDQTKIEGSLMFIGEKIRCRVNNITAPGSAASSSTAEYIKGGIYIQNVDVNGAITFIYRLLGGIHLQNVKVMNSIYFTESTIDGDIHLERVDINEDCWFIKCTIKKGFYSNLLNIKGSIDFSDAIFTYPKSQEVISRLSKKLLDDLGDREQADRYFFLEMDAKRKQKNKIVAFVEKIFISIPFKYGTDFYRVFGLWIFILILFAIFYAFPNVLSGAENSFDYFWFSVFTSVGFEYGKYSLNPQFQFLASLEIAMGTFIWAAFLLIFARKYMR